MKQRRELQHLRKPHDEGTSMAGLIAATAVSLAILVAIGTTGIATAQSKGEEAPLVAVSSKADRTFAKRLSQSTVSGHAFIFVRGLTQPKRVAFYVDDPLKKEQPIGTDTLAPFDLAGTAEDETANPLDTTKLTKGPHNVTVVITDKRDQTHEMFAMFNVANSMSPQGTRTKKTTTTIGTSGAGNAIPIPQADGRTWPSATTTGASEGLESVEGNVKLSTPNLVFENKSVAGTLTVSACGVKVRNVEIRGEGVNAGSGISLKQPESCEEPVVLDKVTVASSGNLTTGILSINGGRTNVVYSKVVGTRDGIVGVTSGRIQDNFIQVGEAGSDESSDGIRVGKSSGLTIRHNTILNRNLQRSAIALLTDLGANVNLRVEDNLIAGGGSACYCGDGVTDKAGDSAHSVNVDFINNVFWKRFYPNVGKTGTGRAYNPAGGGEWTNNTFMEATGTLTSQKVPQPSIAL